MERLYLGANFFGLEVFERCSEFRCETIREIFEDQQDLQRLKARKLWSANRELMGLAKKGVVETGVKRGLKKAHKPWIRGKNGAQTVN